MRGFSGLLSQLDVKTAAGSGRIVWGWTMDENPIAQICPSSYSDKILNPKSLNTNEDFGRKCTFRTCGPCNVNAIERTILQGSHRENFLVAVVKRHYIAPNYTGIYTGPGGCPGFSHKVGIDSFALAPATASPSTTSITAIRHGRTCMTLVADMLTPLRDCLRLAYLSCGGVKDTSSNRIVVGIRYFFVVWCGKQSMLTECVTVEKWESQGCPITFELSPLSYRLLSNEHTRATLCQTSTKYILTNSD